MRINKKNPIIVATFAILILTVGVPVNGSACIVGNCANRIGFNGNQSKQIPAGKLVEVTVSSSDIICADNHMDSRYVLEINILSENNKTKLIYNDTVRIWGPC